MADNLTKLIGNLKPLKAFVNFSPPKIGPLEIEAVTQALTSGWLTTGPRAERFEKVMSEYLGSQGALALSSCTAALHIGLKVMGLGPGDAVITTPLTFVSTTHAAVYNGVRPFLVDVSPDTGNIDPQKIADFLETECVRDSDGFQLHKKTGLKVRALVPVHYAGHPVDLTALWQICGSFNLSMLEDAAHALGSKFNDLSVGHDGHRGFESQDLTSLVAFSFYATKNVSTGEGGLLTSPSPTLLARARKLAAYGITDARRIWARYSPKGTWAYDVDEVGFKANFTDLQAALGLAQMSQLGEFLDLRVRNVQIWNAAFSDIADLVELPTVRKGAVHSWHLYPLRLRTKKLNIGRDEFIKALKALNIGTSVMFIPIHYHSCYKDFLGYGQGDFPIAEDFFSRVVSLPISPATPKNDIEEAAQLAVKLLKQNAKLG
jgi:dTDP-4-amino-4,6-dideoxygalactose transaminase